MAQNFKSRALSLWNIRSARRDVESVLLLAGEVILATVLYLGTTLQAAEKSGFW